MGFDSELDLTAFGHKFILLMDNLIFAAGSVSNNVGGNWHTWSSDCKWFASYDEGIAYMNECHEKIFNQNISGMDVFCYQPHYSADNALEIW